VGLEPERAELIRHTKGCNASDPFFAGLGNRERDICDVQPKVIELHDALGIVEAYVAKRYRGVK
jgi:hypothetical protein